MSEEHSAMTEEELEFEHEEQETYQQALIVLFIFAGLSIGGVLREVNKKTKIPYTPMLIIAGLLLGYYEDSLGAIG